MKTEFYPAAEESVSSREVMNVFITDSENKRREYGILAADVIDSNFVEQQIKEHSQVYETSIAKIEVETYDNRPFKTITL